MNETGSMGSATLDDVRERASAGSDARGDAGDRAAADASDSARWYLRR